MNKSREHLSKDLRGYVKEIVSKILSTKGFAVAIEEVQSLETFDENFQSYKLVKYIRECIERELGDLVDDKVDPLVANQHEHHNDVAGVIDEILASDEFSELLYQLSTSTKTVVNNLMEEGISQPSSCRGDSVNDSSSVIHYSLDNSSEFSSSQEEMLLSGIKLQELTAKLNSSSPESCLEGLSVLRQCPFRDLFHCPEWPTLRGGILRCLREKDKNIMEMCFEILNNMFSSDTSNTSREVHSIMVADLLSHPPFLSNKEYFDVEANRMTLYKVRFLHHIHISVSSHWIRYNERLLEDLIKEFCSLLESSSSHGMDTVSHIHCLALIDPMALWFHKWMHSEHSRAKVTEYFMEKTDLVLYQLQQIMDYPKSTNNQHQSPHSLRSWCVYSMSDLNYLVYNHNMRFIKKLICCARGQDIVSKALISLEGSIKNIPDFLVSLVEAVFYFPTVQSACAEIMSPVKLVTELLGSLATGNHKCRELLCYEKLIDTIIQYIDKEKVNHEMLEGCVDVLSMLATSVDGQKYLLKQKSTVKIVQFVSSSVSSPVPKLTPLLHMCLFYCRQLYSTAEGLLELLHYDLHNVIAQCLDKVRDPEWREMLISNLLNFASTPKGVVLLSQTKLLSECVQYMHERYKLKLQVSHCEKFGYGFMVTQVASTSCGMKCLIEGDYIGDLIQVLWTTLQDSSEPLVIPTHPLDTSNRTLHKAIVNVLNIISSYSSLYEVITSAPSTSTSTNPKTVNEFLNLLLFTDSYQSVLNPIECHLCALRVLSVLVTSLDSFLLLEQTFGVSDRLCRLQEEIRLPNSKYMIDACSIERNRIIVTTSFIGGPNERILPPHYLTKARDEYPCPMFSRDPPPQAYLKPALQWDPRNKVNLSNSTTISHLQNVFMKEIEKAGHLSPASVCLLLEKGLEYQTKDMKPVSLKARTALLQFEEIGIRLVLEYGRERELISSSVCDELSKVYLITGGDIEKGFDWLLSSLFLIFASVCDKDIVEHVSGCLETFSSILTSVYSWKYHPLYSKENLCSVTMHHIELILQAELPLVHSAFKVSGYSTSQACHDMLYQCFWNYLDWPDVCLYLLLLVLYGADYQVYYCVAILSHLETKILKACQDRNLLILLKEEMIDDFHLNEQLKYMKLLEDKYRHIVLNDMIKTTKN